MTDIQRRLFDLRDVEYALFQSKLTPTADADSFIGVRTPALRKFAKEFFKEDGCAPFMKELPHKYFDENMLHAFLIEQIKDYGECIAAVDAFLPYVDNWAVCDMTSPKVFKKHTGELIGKVKEWAKSDETYTCRFGVGMLMKYYLDGEFKAEYLEIPSRIVSDEYYVNMMIAWFFATALAKQYDCALPYLEQGRLCKWVHNKTIQKAIESYRISDAQKAYLRTLKK